MTSSVWTRITHARPDRTTLFGLVAVLRRTSSCRVVSMVVMPSCCLTAAEIVSPMRHTAAVTTQPAAAAAVIADLFDKPIGAGDVRTLAPMRPGLYAWWASPDVLPALVGAPSPSTPALRLLYVGIATRLRRRLVSDHLGLIGSSTLRRTLAGLLLDDEQSAPGGPTASSWSTTTSGD